MARYLVVFLLHLTLPTAGSAPSGDSPEQGTVSFFGKRSAAGAFDQEDVARVFVKGGHRLVKRDLRWAAGDESKVEDFSTLQLHLSSGPKLNMALTPSGILGPGTVISHFTPDGRTERKWDGGNCFSHGHLEDSSGKGLAVISHCRGIFGFASTPGYDYQLLPLDKERSKRDVGEEEEEEDYDVHLMWRRAGTATGESDPDSSDVDGDDDDDFDTETNAHTDLPTDDEVVIDFEGDEMSTQTPPNDDEEKGRREIGEETTEGNNTTYKKVVVEMAMFVDERYWKRIHRAFPDREDNFMLTMVAGAQALYGIPEKVGYDIQIKVKLLEYWKVDPQEYVFREAIGHNMHKFCGYVKKNGYNFDVHALSTGIKAWDDGKVGLAYLNGVCKKGGSCFVKKTFGLDTFPLFAHELGHVLGMGHQTRKSCPQNQTYVGGFMGGYRPYNFSPCMKHRIHKILQKHGAKSCLYNEKFRNENPEDERPLAKLFPGQAKTPDQLCELLNGRGYKYVPLTKKLGKKTCFWLVCYNEDPTSREFRKARRVHAPVGFPCGNDLFCKGGNNCEPFDKNRTIFDPEDLRSMTETPEWSEWSTEFSACSRSCGTGVKTRRRECRYPGYNLAPYCPGPEMKAQLCNPEPCPGDPEDVMELRQIRGDEICKDFKKYNVSLSLRKAKGYFATSSSLTKSDITPPASILDVHSRSCLMKCDRDPLARSGTLDAFRPDGTPCFESNRYKSEMQFLNIHLRCVRGSCLEFTDCPDPAESKDECGECGGDGSTCVNLSFDNTYDVPPGERSFLTTIPSGATNVYVRMDRKINRGAILEMSNYDQEIIIGRSGRYHRPVYAGYNSVKYAGTEWTYSRNAAYLYAPGPTQEGVVIWALRQGRPIEMVTVRYSSKYL